MFQVTADNGGTIKAAGKEFAFVGPMDAFADWRVTAELEGRTLRSLGKGLRAFESGAADYSNAVDSIRALHEQLALARARVQGALQTFASMFTPPGLLDLVVKDHSWDAFEQAARDFCGLVDAGIAPAQVPVEAKSPGA